MTDDELTSRFEAAQHHAQTSAALLSHDPEQRPALHADSDGAAPGPYCSSLEDWVVSVFAPTFARRTTPTFRWCGEWWRHPEAISRLEALWRSWEALRLDPLFGMSSWYSGHLDHQLPILTAAAGPFAECDPTRHFPPENDQLAHVSAPADWWPPARG